MCGTVFKESYFDGMQAPFEVRWSKCPAGSGVYPLHWHVVFEMHLMTRGYLKCVINDKVHVMDRNSLLIVRPRENHQYISSPVLSERLSLFLNPDWLGRSGRFGDAIPSLVALNDGETALMLDLLRRAREEVDEKLPLWKELARHLILEFVLLVRRAARRPATGSVTITPLMQKLIAYLDVHYMRTMTIKELGAFFGYSGFHLEHEFSRCFGMGIKHYILQRRINEAQMLMVSNPNLTLASIAQTVGFKDYAVFQRAFLKNTALTPVRYRKKVHLFSKDGH